ncbi:MAG: hypothetical protein COV55_04705 [Candidatus Komeilibacteria bacterium CG11_big_fil_rev_8_21_14_0_20_36_20]|uniref:Uncharacterized protein n=1 Tax=Candidatus Komeilibacteria bacterium CG11_big_fil_rev_8_21_14_0_20_36_20 TaxID=1974477 RepID=A0A2H0NB79_9BACT|nr:MAG: hypothetical protein COV55_04705 [Candidatus Komeilibacteria bacterium CG11_big_fil_rev_8_21_14_0_20_36_20]PIR81854.1 MAG: hypothetical protein COU21_01615 [Candidatus Komeilibacteria bacterium CG10_big_fil_rev_8_21_14_0_10_36_65]PJC55062.1 MAG: hypothetical protein CO027_03970 [Candidatus Komeilibacteria bacterium CG_4_9_14_0_2_um_filter_36_13]
MQRILVLSKTMFGLMYFLLLIILFAVAAFQQQRWLRFRDRKWGKHPRSFGELVYYSGNHEDGWDYAKD